MLPQLKGFYDSCTPQRFTAAADQSQGDVVVNNGRVGVVVDDVASGDDGLYVVGTDVHGVEVPHAAVACARDEDAYWDEDGDPVGGTAGTGAVTNVAAAGANIRIGRFAQSAAVGDAKAVVELTNS